MIKLERKEKPQVITDNQASWQQALDLAIAKYGSYRLIPQKEKESLISHYRHVKIKDILFESSHEKCAFCECKPGEGGNIEIEHFKPKSIYPELTFEWDNFLPSCRKCNGSKLDHDTGAYPIVNPYEDNPEELFCYSDIRIQVFGHNKVAQNTIDVCGLNSVRLMKPRSEILVSLHDFSDAIKEAVADYKNCNTELQKTNRARKISESIERIEMLANPKERYSAFCKYYLKHCAPYNEAKIIVAELIC